MEHDYVNMTMKSCPAKNCKFKNIWQKSIDHHVFYHKDTSPEDPHKEHKERLIAMKWTLDYKYGNAH